MDAVANNNKPSVFMTLTSEGTALFLLIIMCYRLFVVIY